MAFASPRIASGEHIINVGFENDWVFKANSLLFGRNDYASSTDNIIFYNDEYASGEEPGAVFLPDDTSAHAQTNYIELLNRVSVSSFQDEIRLDTNIVVVDTDQRVTDRESIVSNHQNQPTFYLGQEEGIDTVVAGTGNDTIEGFGGNDILDGNDGNDRIHGGAGNDDLRGGQGNDIIDGGEGEDHATFEGLRTDYRITGPSGGAQTVTNIVTGEVDQLNSIECIKFESNHNIALTNAFVDHGGSSIPANDDGSSSFIDITSVFSDGLNFFGRDFTGVYVNNNGNVTFGSPLSTYTPGLIGGSSSLAIIAPFWGDVDTRGAGSLVRYGLDAERGTFTATWANVDYYSATSSTHASIFNSFQLELIDQGCGDFEIIFRYADINWTTGDASNGVGGLGGNVARAGFSFGDQVHYFELPQSGNQSGMLSLENVAGNAGTGVWRFSVRDGEVIGIGTTGNDELEGDRLDNFLDGGAGNDRLDGGAGNDTISGGDGDDQVFGGDGNDEIIAGHGGGNDGYDGGADVDTITFLSTSQGIVVDLQQGVADGIETGHDTLVGIENIVAGSGNDVLTGNDGANRVTGGAGDDVIDGRGGRDTAVFSSIFDPYAIVRTTTATGATAYIVSNALDGTDTLIDVELAEFRDGTYRLETGQFAATPNTAPVAQDDGYVLDEDAVLSIAGPSGLLANDLDGNANALISALVQGPSHGVLALNDDGSFVYTPDANYFGLDSFRYRAEDAISESDVATVNLVINSTNDVPIPDADGPYVTAEDTFLFVDAANGVLSGDRDIDGETLSAQLLSGAAFGTVTLNADGSFTYAPGTNFNGADSFVYRASDGIDSSGPVTVAINVSAVEDRPLALDDAGFVTARAKSLNVSAASILANDTDGDPELAQKLSVISVGEASGGKVTLKNGVISFVPKSTFSGVASFTYVVSDGGGTSKAKVNIAVAARDGSLNLLGTANNDKLVGKNGNDVLKGLAGSDTLSGGAGNDMYHLDDGNDRVTDTSGIDTIRSTITRSLNAYSSIEKLILDGNQSINGTGNKLANDITGNRGANFLDGLGGNDILAGGAGRDSFAFTTALDAKRNVDKIKDFRAIDDTIVLENSIFKSLSLGTLASSKFAANKTGVARDADDRIIYNSSNGNIFYDSDGTGKANAVHFASVTKGLSLTASDFFIV